MISSAPKVSCPSGWIVDADGEDCFKFVNESHASKKNTWERNFCDSLEQGAELVVLEDDNLVDLVREFFSYVENIRNITEIFVIFENSGY